MSNESLKSPRRCSGRSFVMGLLLGAAAGAAAGLLLAPKPGSELLGELKSKVNKTHGQAGKVADEGSTQIKASAGDLGTLINAKLALLKQAFEAGRQAARAKHQQLNKLETVEAAREASSHG